MVISGTALQNLNRVPIPPQPTQGGAQKPYKTSSDLSDIKCDICGEMAHYASAHRYSEIQQPRASGALFLKDTFGPGELVQGKLATLVEVENEDVTMLTAPVTLRDGGVKERP